MTAFTEPQNPKLGVYASPEEWWERLDSLPDRQALGGKIPSFYCEFWIAVAKQSVLADPYCCQSLMVVGISEDGESSCIHSILHWQIPLFYGPRTSTIRVVI